MATPTYPFDTLYVDPPAPARPPALPGWITHTFTDRRRQDLADFQMWLEGFRLDDLRAKASEHGWLTKGNRKADIARQLADNLTTPVEVIKTVSRLSADQKGVLAAIGLVGGLDGFRLADMERVATGWNAATRSNVVGRAVTDLLNKTLVGLTEDHYFGDPIPYIPRILARSMPPLLADRLPHFPQAPSRAQDSQVRQGDASGFARALLQLLLLFEQAPTPLRPPMPRPRLENQFAHLKLWDYDPDELQRLNRQDKLRFAGQGFRIPPPQPPLPDDVMGRLAPLLGDEKRLEFAYALLLATGIIMPGSPITLWDEVKDVFLRQNEPTQLATLARVYFDMATWTEFWPILRNQPALALVRNPSGFGAHQLTPQSLLAEFARFRHIVLRVLAWLPDNEWIPIENLIDLLRTVWPSLAPNAMTLYFRAEAQQGAWYLTWHDKPVAKEGRETWTPIQGAYIMQMLTGPLHWLGLVDLARQRDVPYYIRLRGLADLYWDRTELLETRPVDTLPATERPVDFEIQDDLITVNPSLLKVEGHTLLDKIARLEQAQPFRFVYRLDVGTLHRSFEHGATLDDLTEAWQTAFGKPMPDTLLARIETWWTSYGQVRLYRDVTIIEFGDDYALAEMKAVSSLEKLMIAEISPRLVVISKDAVAQLTAELQKAGYTPRQTHHE